MNKKIESLKSLILEDVSVGIQLVNDVNSWNNSLNYLEVFSMDDFDEIMEGYTPFEVAQRIFFGDFNPNHVYFRFNGYANLESLGDYELDNEIMENALYIAQKTVELYEEGHLPYLDYEVLELLEDEEEDK